MEGPDVEATSEVVGGAARAPRATSTLAERAVDPSLTAEACGIERWLEETAQGMLTGTRYGHAPSTRVPPHMLRPGPLRDAMLREFAFRAMGEEIATRGIGYMVINAPDLATMDFYATQLIDEARHADVFRGHLVELGIPAPRLAAAMMEMVGRERETVLEPLERFAVRIGRAGDFIGQVVVLTIIVEGALAPAAEMSEYKWRVFDPPAAEIAHGANLDERRHLGVGTAVVLDHLRGRPQDRERIEAVISEGMHLWETLPLTEVLVGRESLFQQGIEEHGALLGNYELVPGRRLVDTTAEERLELQSAWSREMRRARLSMMGLSVA
jgi:hypothetical protein